MISGTAMAQTIHFSTSDVDVTGLVLFTVATPDWLLLALLQSEDN